MKKLLQLSLVLCAFQISNLSNCLIANDTVAMHVFGHGETDFQKVVPSFKKQYEASLDARPLLVAQISKKISPGQKIPVLERWIADQLLQNAQDRYNYRFFSARDKAYNDKLIVSFSRDVGANSGVGLVGISGTLITFVISISLYQYGLMFKDKGALVAGPVVYFGGAAVTLGSSMLAKRIGGKAGEFAGKAIVAGLDGIEVSVDRCYSLLDRYESLSRHSSCTLM